MGKLPKCMLQVGEAIKQTCFRSRQQIGSCEPSTVHMLQKPSCLLCGRGSREIGQLDVLK